MEKDQYIVTIPAVLTQLMGKQNVREQIEEATRGLFYDWAKDELVERITVKKPRVSNKKDKDDG